MTQPTAYDPTISFEEEEENLVAGRSTVRTAALDAELANIATSVNEIISNLTAIQRDDTNLRDGIVKLPSLSAEVLALLGSAGFTLHNPIGWLTATNYVAREIVTNGTGTYVSVVAHTSGVFATDLAAGKWALIYNSANYTASGISFAPSGTLLSQNVQDAIQELDASTIKGTTTRGGLTSVLFPTMGGGWKDIVRSGWLPWSFNQQWGGAPMPFDIVDSVSDTLYRFDAASGFSSDNDIGNIAAVAGGTWRAQGFKVSRAMNLQAVWIKVYKVGNPTNNLELRILPDDGSGTKPTGSTPITNGTATAQSGKLHTATDANLTGYLVRFNFPTPPALVAGTQYHITLKSSGAVDGTNYWVWRFANSAVLGRYPHGAASVADGTPTWSVPFTGFFSFLIEPVSADQILRSGGQFDAKMVFNEGTPLNQSAGLVQPLSRFFNNRKGTILVRGKSFTKDKTIFDATYGLDHDRIVLRSNITTGFPQVDLYKSDGTKLTVTGTTDISAAVFNDIAVVYRAFGDGADYLKLYVNGSVEGSSLTGQTISFDENFQQLGHAWLGGGFPIAPAWTQKLAMGVLPSADSPAWTWTGTGTEGLCMSVSGGKLYQNKNGYGNQTGYYEKTALGLSNANGWAENLRLRVASSSNSKDTAPAYSRMADGVKVHDIFFAEFFCEAGASPYAYPQKDFKSAESVVLHIGKGSDAFFFVNGRLLMDGTSKMTDASASNLMNFGDLTASAGENADVIWDYAAYYNTAWLPPQFTSGEIHEFAYWQDDRSAVLPTLYNSGTQQSVKSYIGVEENWVGEPYVMKIQQQGITTNPTTVTTTPLLRPEMECFAIGETLLCDAHNGDQNVTANAYMTSQLFVDGIGPSGQRGDQLVTNQNATASVPSASLVKGRYANYFGLHKVESKWTVNGGTATNTSRQLNVEART